MSTEYIKIGLDILILAGLGGFIFYALQLSRALNAFRAHRNEFDGIMNNLTKQIDSAQAAVSELKETSQTSGDNLHKLVKDAQFLSDDLQQINDAGNALASRLERLAENARKNIQISEDDYAENVRPMSKKKKQPKSDGFNIHDPDFDDEDDFGADIVDDPEMGKLSSAAEKELYKALKKNKK